MRAYSTIAVDSDHGIKQTSQPGSRLVVKHCQFPGSGMLPYFGTQPHMGQATSAFSSSRSVCRAAGDYSLGVTPKHKSKLSMLRQQCLTTHPPDGERWNQWIDAFSSVPHIDYVDAASILYFQPELLRSRAFGIILRLSQMADLLASKAALSSAEFSHLLKVYPRTATVHVDKASAVLIWFETALHIGKPGLNSIVRNSPDLLAYSVEELQSRLQAWLDLSVSLDDIQSFLTHHPRLLAISPSSMAEKLDILSSEFGCSKQYILTSAAYMLRRPADVLVFRAAFLRQLGFGNVSIQQVWCVRSDLSFSEGQVLPHLRRTGKTLRQLCSEFYHLPGMGDAMAQDGMLPLISTPLQCLQAYHSLWKTRRAASPGQLNAATTPSSSKKE